MVPTASPSSSRVVRDSASPADAGSGQGSLRDVVDWLAELGVTEHWVVSCYLKLEPRDRSRGKYQIKLKNRVRDRLQWFERQGVSRGEREQVERDLERIRLYLEDSGNLPTGQGIAIFACEALDLFRTVELPRVFRSRLAIDRSPLIRELAAVDDEFGRVLCAAYDRSGARFFEVTAIGGRELPGLATDATRGGKFHGAGAQSGGGTGSGSAGEHNYHQRIKEEKQRHYAAVAQRLFELSRDRVPRGIVLAGIGDGSDAVESHLHPYVSRLLLGSTRVNPKTASVSEIVTAVMEVRASSERRWENEHVAAMRDGLGTGWAVNGVPDVLLALQHGQVRTLLVDPTAEQPGFRCSVTRKLGLTEQACEAEGTAELVPDVIDEVIEETLRQGGHIEVVEDEAARTGIAGLAALLRFKRS